MASPNIQRMPGESEGDFRRRYHREWERLDKLAKGKTLRRETGGPCSVAGCDRRDEIKGMCGKHYRKQRLEDRKAAGIVETDVTAHPLYVIWRERKVRNSLCVEWAADFRLFVRDVGERPSPTHLLRKVNRQRPYGPTNFEWLDALKRQEGETVADFNARQWQSRRQRLPDYEGRRWLMRKYGITPEIYQRMFKEQEEVCAICKRPEISVHKSTQQPKALSVDHCHATDRVRGLLCWECNSTLGKVHDNTEVLRSMIAYLESDVDHRNS